MAIYVCKRAYKIITHFFFSDKSFFFLRLACFRVFRTRSLFYERSKETFFRFFFLSNLSPSREVQKKRALYISICSYRAYIFTLYIPTNSLFLFFFCVSPFDVVGNLTVLWAGNDLYFCLTLFHFGIYSMIFYF